MCRCRYNISSAPLVSVVALVAPRSAGTKSTFRRCRLWSTLYLGVISGMISLKWPLLYCTPSLGTRIIRLGV